MTGERLVLVVNALYSHWLLLLQTFSAVVFYCHFYWCNKAPSKTVCCSFKEFDVTRIRPRLRGLPGLAGRAARLGLGWRVTPAIMSLLCKRDQIKRRHYMDMRATPQNRHVPIALGTFSNLEHYFNFPALLSTFLTFEQNLSIFSLFAQHLSTFFTCLTLWVAKKRIFHQFLFFGLVSANKHKNG